MHTDTHGSRIPIGGRAGEPIHVPVLLAEVIQSLALRPGDDAIDCTYGGGGYTRAMLEATAPDGRVLAIDRDPSVKAAEVTERLVLVHGSFGDVGAIAERAGYRFPRAIVADLGLSSLQLADSDRGFSFAADGPLDMRFSAKGGSASGGDTTPTAADLIASSTSEDLERIIREYGEERHARAIAQAIVASRKEQAITTTGQLAEIIAARIPRRPTSLKLRGVKGSRIHPATRTFQALRIAVNDELGTLQRAIPQMMELVAPGGRIAIVSFHSLEDRIVKRAFRDAEQRGWGRVVTKKPIGPSEEEIERNTRSRSAKLRVIERRY